jgi:3-hydroxyisobutyrate dehydrogenase-like beta-hydroxyacid dehydrogenase
MGMAKIAFLGAGAMGQAMVPNLLRVITMAGFMTGHFVFIFALKSNPCHQ